MRVLLSYLLKSENRSRDVESKLTTVLADPVDKIFNSLIHRTFIKRSSVKRSDFPLAS